MEAQWFRERLRAAGKTTQDLALAIGRDRAVVSRVLNGHQEMTPAQAEAFATVLEAPLDEVLEHAGMFSSAGARKAATGFGEADAAPWTGHAPGGRAAEPVAAALGAKPGIDVWRVKTLALALMGYMPEDFVLVDTHQSERARPGDVVIAQVYDWSTGSASTVLRRYEPPVLVAASPDREDWRVHVVDGTNVVIRGKVVASWRT